MKVLCLLPFFLLTPLAPLSAQTSAFSARDLAAQRVNDGARGKVLQIIGHRTEGSTLPKVWDVLFYDTYASQNGTMVTVQNGSLGSIRAGFTQLEKARLLSYKEDEVLSPVKLKKDSDDVLALLRRGTVLQKIAVSSTAMHLKIAANGSGSGIWHVTLYAPSLKDKTEIRIGTAQVSAETGQILSFNVNAEPAS
jgi:hypothetical protein